MDILTLSISLALGVIVLVVILYPLWQQTRPEAIFRIDRSGQSLEEYQARYQAVLASIKDLMFDHEMGKISTEDYEPLLARSKLEAAEIRRHIDRLSRGNVAEIDPGLETEIEALVAQLKSSHSNGNETLLREIEAEIESLKNIHFTGATLQCPNCGQPYEIADAFCTGCGQPLPEHSDLPVEEICSECGQPCEPDDAFCAKCGAPLTESQTA
jgi:hypothetical protein